MLSRGLLSGKRPSSPADYRSYLPRFTGEEGARNAAIVEKLRALADAGGRTPSQLCVAWVLAKQPTLVPLIGARTQDQLEDVLGALAKPLSAKEVAEVEALVPQGAIEGPRYQPAMMAHLDSEK